MSRIMKTVLVISFLALLAACSSGPKKRINPPRASIQQLAVQADGATVTTIEGVALNGTMHPVQEGFRQEHGLQCGFCTPGMIISAVDLLSRTANPNEAEIRDAIDGNLCRCTGYHNIVRAVQHAAQVIATASTN